MSISARSKTGRTAKLNHPEKGRILHERQIVGNFDYGFSGVKYFERTGCSKEKCRRTVEKGAERAVDAASANARGQGDFRTRHRLWRCGQSTAEARYPSPQ